MPLLVAFSGNPVTSNPDFRPAVVLVVILLAVLGTVLLTVTLFWINRRMKLLGISYSRRKTPSSKDFRETVDPWAEAGRRVDRDLVDTLYDDDED